jgi:hypothetical protein
MAKGKPVTLADYFRKTLTSEPGKVFADRYDLSTTDISKLKRWSQDVLAPELEKHGLTLTSAADLAQLRADVTAYKRAAFAAMRDSYGGVPRETD